MHRVAVPCAVAVAVALAAASVAAVTPGALNRYVTIPSHRLESVDLAAAPKKEGREYSLSALGKKKKADYSWMPRGVVLWSHGRSGTSAFWETMRTWCLESNLKIRTICHMKEGFRVEPASVAHLDSCMSDIPPQRPFFTHLKPGHLVRDSDIPTPYEFLKRIKAYGGKVLIIIRRQNWLARAVSAAELLMEKSEETREIGSEGRHRAMSEFFAKQSYDESATSWAERLDRQSGALIDQGEMAGRKLGYRVIKFNYDKENWPCTAVKQAVEAVVEEGILPHMPGDMCVDSHKMADRSHRELSLEERVGPAAANIIYEGMKGTKFEWMLDLDSESPPDEATLAY